MPELTSLARTLPRSGIRVIMDLAFHDPDVIHLEVGDPDFSTPSHIVQAAADAGSQGFTHYSPTAGLPSLRQLIADKLGRVDGLAVGPDQVVVTPGSAEALLLAALAFVEPGEEVLIPDPCWPNFEMMIRTARAVPVRYPLDRHRDFQPDLEVLERLISARSRMVLVNSPGNPTGAVFGPEVIQGLADVARRHDLVVVSDECYDQIVFDGEHVGMAQYTGLERTVVVQSFSKTYAMTGWRLGYAVASPEVTAAMIPLQESIVSCASTISQKAAEAALQGPQDCVTAMRENYRRRRDFAVDIVGRAGLLPAVPHGAFYMLVDISAATTDTYAFAKELVLRDQVAVAPGETFGPGGRGLVRVSLATDERLLRTGLERLVAAVQREARLPVATR